MLTTHLVVDPCATKDDILIVKKKAVVVTSEYNFEHTTVEIEFEDEDCSMAVPKNGQKIEKKS